jgi:ferredoxin
MIKRVWIDEGCTACELCVDLCPAVFEVPGDTAVVRKDVNYDDYEDCIIEAAESCPVEVIRYETK